MKTVKIILVLLIGIAIGAMVYYFLSQHQPGAAKPTDGLRISHSSSQADRAAMEAAFADQYARLHRAKDLEGLMAMVKSEGVGENIISSMKGWMERSFAQQIVGVSFRELNDGEIRKLPDLTLRPLLECKISYAQTNAGDVMQSTTCILGAEAGHLYLVEPANK